MPKYTIEIRETLSRVVEMEAESVEEAKEKVFDKYTDGKYILDSGDCNHLDIEEYNG